ncbi:hypothetical protein K0M31_006511 [Melipona bicolor]|uniref:Uncharacterized protein n=1 Tax=Melipona bicolor TaxID=60889 RepID=A0AA40KLZ7_9HYME|nr:hypothetical protein K0M31_006511 [Melipona bicolor]
MAEVATKKSINVLDNITASNKQLISLCDNNDDEDDLILTNNTRNELDTDDKSLQELIESELALRICSSTEEETGLETDNEQQDEVTPNEPETVKRIVLDRQQDALDVNAEFIAAETEHSVLVEKPYSYQNGHMSPETKVSDGSNSYVREETVKPEPIAVSALRDEEEEQVFVEQPEVGSAIVIEETTTDDVDQLARDSTSDDGKFPQNEENEDPCPSYPVLRSAEATDRPEVTSMTYESPESSYDPVEEDQLTATSSPLATYVDKYQQEKEIQDTIFESVETNIEKDVGQKRETAEDDSLRKNEIADTWSEQSVETEDQQSGQFSDNFDQSLCQEDVVAPETQLEETASENNKQADLFELTDTECDCKQVDEVKDLVSSVDEESKTSMANDKSSSSVEEKILEDQEEPSVPGKLAEEPEKEEEEEEEEEVRGTPTMQSRSFDEGTLSHSESCSTDAASTQEFLDTERRVLNEENCDQYPHEDVQGVRESSTTERVDARIRNLLEEDEEARMKEEEAKEEVNDNADEQNAITESSSELSVSEPTFIEKTEVVISESSVKIVSETTQCLEIENEAEPVDELESPARAPLATPDDETSDVSNAGDTWSRSRSISNEEAPTNPEALSAVGSVARVPFRSAVLNTPSIPLVFHLATRTRPTVAPCPVETANRGNPTYPPRITTPWLSTLWRAPSFLNLARFSRTSARHLQSRGSSGSSNVSIITSAPPRG